MLFKGFTLLELLIVMLMIGVIISFATLAIGDKKQQILRQEIKQLAALIQFTQQEAIFKNQDFSIHFTDHYYHFYVLTEFGWRRLKNAPFHSRQLAAGVIAELNIENEIMQLSEASPQLLILSSGEMSPFNLTLWHEADLYQRLLLTGNLLGELEIKPEDTL